MRRASSRLGVQEHAGCDMGSRCNAQMQLRLQCMQVALLQRHFQQEDGPQHGVIWNRCTSEWQYTLRRMMQPSRSVTTLVARALTHACGTYINNGACVCPQLHHSPWTLLSLLVCEAHANFCSCD